MLDCIFSSKSLRVLKLDLTNDILQKPIGDLASLEDLSLSKMLLSDDCHEERISTACPSLTRLTISNLSDGMPTVRISSESLEELDIFNPPPAINKIDISIERLRKLSLDLNPLHDPFDCILKVEAPNLQDLRWTGAVNDIDLSEWKFLEKASLCLDINRTNCEEETTRILAVVQSIHHVSELQINSDIFELLFQHDRLRIALNNLHHLTITVDGLKEYHFPVFASVLMVSPKLQTLSLKFSGNPYRPRYELPLCSKAAEFKKLLEQNQNLIGDHLSAIVVELKENYYRTRFVFEDETRVVIEDMVKVAKGLKKITVFYPGERLLIMLKIWRDIWKAFCPRLEVNLVEKRI